MSKHRIILIIGIILVFLPFGGLSSFWESALVFISGGILIALSVHSSVRRRVVMLRRRRQDKDQRINQDPTVGITETVGSINQPKSYILESEEVAQVNEK